jgi:hypothetical protein
LTRTPYPKWCLKQNTAQTFWMLTMADVSAAIATVESSLQTHKEWRDYWLRTQRHPNFDICEKCIKTAKLVGDLEHHLTCVKEYENVLEILHTLKESE